MFDYVRKHTKVMMGILFLLIIPSFVLFGIEGYSRFQEKGATVARIGSLEISQAEWDAEHKNEVDRMRTAMPGLDVKFFDSPQARQATLERMMRDRVLAEAATKARLITSDARLARELQANPTIAGLRRPDGSLDIERYRQLLGSQGMTPEMFEARVRADLSTRQVESGLLRSATSHSSLAELALQAFYERREVQLARFPSSDFTAQVKPDSTELQAYYQANQALFQSPEQARIEYVVLDLDTVRKGIVLNEQDLKSYYAQNTDRLSGQEERRASHILLTAPKDAPVAQREKARAQATELLQAARKTPSSFAALARQNSQDPGSASNGGDLGFFTRGAMVKPFEDAVFKLKQGEISDLVETDYGFHIITLTEIKTPKQKTFEELRGSLETELKNQQAQRKFAEAAETFSNMVYEQPDSLQPVAERLKLDIRTAQVQRQPGPEQRGPLAHPKLLDALFQTDTITQKRNTQAIETGASQLVAARMVEHQPARTLPFAEVEKNVRERVIQQKASELARKLGQEKLAAWKEKPETANLPSPVLVSRDQPQSLPPAVLDAVLRADLSQLPAWTGVDLGIQGFAVVRINKVVMRSSPAADMKRQELAQYAQWWGQAEAQAYENLLKQRFKAEVKLPSTASPNKP